MVQYTCMTCDPCTRIFEHVDTDNVARALCSRDFKTRVKSHVQVQRFSNFLKMGNAALSHKNSADHLILVPFESKFIILVAYFNTSIVVCNLARSIIGVQRTIRADWVSAKLLKCRKYMRRFGTLILYYEFRWSLAGLQAQHQMCRENTTFIVL